MAYEAHASLCRYVAADWRSLSVQEQDKWSNVARVLREVVTNNVIKDMTCKDCAPAECSQCECVCGGCSC